MHNLDESIVVMLIIPLLVLDQVGMARFAINKIIIISLVSLLLQDPNNIMTLAANTINSMMIAKFPETTLFHAKPVWI
jgi:hypothetical protein